MQHSVDISHLAHSVFPVVEPCWDKLTPLRSRPHSWLPSTNPPYFALASLQFLSPLFLPVPFPSFLSPSSFALHLYVYNMPIQLVHRPVPHYMQLYRLCNLWRRLWRYVRPTLQRRAVFCSPRQALTTTIFSLFRQHFHSNRWRLCFASCKCRFHYDITTAMSVTFVESLCDLFLPVVQSQAIDTTLANTFSHTQIDIHHQKTAVATSLECLCIELLSGQICVHRLEIYLNLCVARVCCKSACH